MLLIVCRQKVQNALKEHALSVRDPVFLLCGSVFEAHVADCMLTEGAECTEGTCTVRQRSSLSAASESAVANQQDEAQGGKCSSHVEENLHQS